MKDQHLVIDAQRVFEQVKVYDALGRLFLREKPRATHSEINLDQIRMGGFFIVELIDETGRTLNRKMIKY